MISRAFSPKASRAMSRCPLSGICVEKVRYQGEVSGFSNPSMVSLVLTSASRPKAHEGDGNSFNPRRFLIDRVSCLGVCQ